MKSAVLIGSAIVALSAAIAWPSSAHHELDQSGAEAIALKDGATLWVFKDRKMALEDTYGHARSIERGRSFEALDGRTITATSDESARLRSLIRKGHKGGS